jgi:hypothetical protein
MNLRERLADWVHLRGGGWVFGFGGDRWTRGACREAILALPMPSPADRLADARKLPEVAALIDKLQAEAAFLEPETLAALRALTGEGK